MTKHRFGMHMSANFHVSRILVLLMAIGAMGCAAPGAVQQTTRDASSQVPTHENLNSVLWVQTSVEYAAVAEQAYRLAERVLDEALADPTWTASLEQSSMDDLAGLPPAVVLDVDETVLDNSAYQARLILDGKMYDTASWNAWANEAAATAVPGALAFTRHADSLGITVIYLTNRRAVVEDATRRNLVDLGFPVSDDADVILTRGETEAWSASDKTPRREFLAGAYRILLLIGDNLGDFVADADLPPLERKQALAPFRHYWGSRWIMLPNPQYGSWEGAVIDFDFSAAPEVQRQRKRAFLNPGR